MPYKDRDRQREYQKLWQRKTSQSNSLKQRKRAKLAEYKATLACQECGEDHPATIDFHHRDPNTKEFQISLAVTNGIGWQRIVDEIAKCDVLCRNCHAKLHWNN